MSVPLDRLYHFLQNQMDSDVVIYHWSPHGSRKLCDIQPLIAYKSSEYLYRPSVIFHDQEFYDPTIWTEKEFRDTLQLHICKHYNVSMVEAELNLLMQQGLNSLASFINQFDQSVLVHSNYGLTALDEINHVPCYYWAHALISLDWFRYAQHLKKPDPIAKDPVFLCYNRAWTGSREYRVKFAEMLSDTGFHKLFRTWFTPTANGIHVSEYEFRDNRMRPNSFDFISKFKASASNANSSADFDLEHYKDATWEIVLETVFDADSIFLTEKIFRPMVCRVPFILAAAPGSLKFLQRYGFKTFGDLIDESYDDIQDPLARLNGIIRAVNSVTKLTGRDLERLQNVTEHNFNHVFSHTFFSNVVEEFKQNMKTALDTVRSNQSRLDRGRHLPTWPKRLVTMIYNRAKSGQSSYIDLLKFIQNTNQHVNR